MKERFLPIGTVVLLKGGIKEVMILSYCIFPNNKQYTGGQEVKKQMKLYEYGGCVYPEGIIDANTMCGFNHDQIEKICHMGYETPAQSELSVKINEQYENFKNEIENK